MTTVRILTAAVMCSALALAACQKKAEAPAADAAPPADAAAAPADASAMPAGGTPAECQAYLDHVNACVTKLSASNPAVADSFKSSMEATRASWAQVTDQVALASACKQADDAFSASSKASGC